MINPEKEDIGRKVIYNQEDGGRVSARLESWGENIAYITLIGDHQTIEALKVRMVWNGPRIKERKR